jgi:hypothetical protein
MDIKLLIASGAAAVALLAAPVARADLVFKYSTNGGTSFTNVCDVPTGTGTCGTGQGSMPLSSNWMLQGNAVSQSPGPPNPDLLETIVGGLTNNAGTTQTIILSIGDVNFTTPTPSGLNLISSIGGEVGINPPSSQHPVPYQLPRPGRLPELLRGCGGLSDSAAAVFCRHGPFQRV